MRRLLRLASLGAVAIVVGGCTLPIPVSVATWTLDGVSYLTTNKSLTDHGLSMIFGQDCAKHRIVTDGEICEDAPVVGPVLVEDTTAPAPVITVAELQTPVEQQASVDDDVVAPAAFALAAIDAPLAADPIITALEFPEDNFALALATPPAAPSETVETAVALGGVDVSSFETAAGPTETTQQVAETVPEESRPRVENSAAFTSNEALARFEFADLVPVASIQSDAVEERTVQAEAPAPGGSTSAEVFDPAVYAPARFEPEAVQMAEIPEAPGGIEIASAAPVDLDPPVALLPSGANRLEPTAYEPDAVAFSSEPGGSVTPAGATAEVAAVRDFLKKIQSIFSTPDPDVAVASAQPDGSVSIDQPASRDTADDDSGGDDTPSSHLNRDLGPNMVPDQPPELG